MNGLLKIKHVRILFISQSLLLKGVANETRFSVSHSIMGVIESSR